MKLNAVIAIAVGEGGVEALTTILSTLPGDFPAVILVAMHRSPDKGDDLAQRIDCRTALTVCQARSGDKLRAGYVFLAPPDYHLIVATLGVVWLTVDPEVHGFRPAADPLFTSISDVYQDQAVGVVLTGSDGDGAAGITAIKRAGGKTIAQSEESSENPSMPHSAIVTGRVDLILPLRHIAGALEQMVGSTVQTVQTES